MLFEDALMKILFSNQGNLLATVKENNLHLWNFLSGKLNT